MGVLQGSAFEHAVSTKSIRLGVRRRSSTRLSTCAGAYNSRPPLHEGRVLAIPRGGGATAIPRGGGATAKASELLGPSRYQYSPVARALSTDWLCGHVAEPGALACAVDLVAALT